MRWLKEWRTLPSTGIPRNDRIDAGRRNMSAAIQLRPSAMLFFYHKDVDYD
jgi:hypothetical protein